MRNVYSQHLTWPNRRRQIPHDGGGGWRVPIKIFSQKVNVSKHIIKNASWACGRRRHRCLLKWDFNFYFGVGEKFDRINIPRVSRRHLNWFFVCYFFVFALFFQPVCFSRLFLQRGMQKFCNVFMRCRDGLQMGSGWLRVENR